MYFTDTPELRKFEKEMKQVPNFDREKVGDNISSDSNYSVIKIIHQKWRSEEYWK